MFMRKNGIAPSRKLYLIRRLTIVLVSVIVLQGTPRAWAETGNTAADIGLGIASFVTTLPYGALKLAYAGLGAIFGGFTYVLTGGNEDAAGSVWEKSMLGTYVITPSQLTGDEPIRFIGP